MNLPNRLTMIRFILAIPFIIFLQYSDSSKYGLIFRFALVYVITYLLNIFFLWLFKKFGFENMYINGFVLLIPLAAVSFLLNKFFVFRRWYEKDQYSYRLL